MTRHAWMLDVLNDIAHYAAKNDLRDVCRSVLNAAQDVEKIVHPEQPSIRAACAELAFSARFGEVDAATGEDMPTAIVS